MIFIAMFSLPQCTGGLHYALVVAADIVLLPIDSLACRSWTGRVEICDECNLTWKAVKPKVEALTALSTHIRQDGAM